MIISKEEEEEKWNNWTENAYIANYKLFNLNSI